ncbi:MAG: LytTR family DNA-binding domain-containing protein, partial [Bacteroidota bacterium]
PIGKSLTSNSLTIYHQLKMKTFNAIIVEDEPAGMNSLKYKLEEYCPEINVIAWSQTAKKAIEHIKKLRPDVVFLDVRLDRGTGFDVLEAIPFTAFEVIITTAYDEYAMKAIKKQVLDYLDKPIKVSDLQAAVRKLVEKKSGSVPPPRKISLPVSSGEKYVNLEDILYLEAANTRSQAVLCPDEANPNHIFPIELTRLLGEMEHQLSRYGFCRPSKSYLVNLQNIKEYIRKDGGWIIMKDDKAINISSRFKESFHICRNNWMLQG